MIATRQHVPVTETDPDFPSKPSIQSRQNGPFKSVLAGMALVLFLGMTLLAVGGYFAYHAFRNAGIDLDLLRRKPVFAMTKLTVARNPNLEILSADDNADTITARDRNTSNINTYRYDLDTRSLAVVPDDVKPAQTAAAADGANNSFEVKGPDGSMKFGAAAAESVPQWVPVYGGATLRGTTTTRLSDGEQNSFTFQTKDAPIQVLSFYETTLKGNGFAVNVAMTGAEGVMLQGQADGGKRTVVITLHSSSQGTEGSIVTVEQK